MMKKSKKIKSVCALFSFIVPILTGCATTSAMLEGALPDSAKNRLIFTFAEDIHFQETAENAFQTVYKNNEATIVNWVESQIAEQEFVNFFVNNFKYEKTTAKNIFLQVKDMLMLNIITNSYLTKLDQFQSLDDQFLANRDIIFTTDNWHTKNTLKPEYNLIEKFQAIEQLFGENLYDNLADGARDQQLATLAADINENLYQYIQVLFENNLLYDTSTETKLPEKIDDDILKYQLQLKRFGRLLSFRYGQELINKIYKELNQTLFTMSYLLNKIFTIENDEIIVNNNYVTTQFQQWDPSQTEPWKTNLHFNYFLETTAEAATTIDKNWSTSPLDDLVKTSHLNLDFFKLFANNSYTVSQKVDPLFNNKGYQFADLMKQNPKYAAKSTNNITGKWLINDENIGDHVFYENNKARFIYDFPLYFVDIILNLNFNFYQNIETPKIITNNPRGISLTTWITNFGVASQAPSSKLIRIGTHDETDTTAIATDSDLQKLKWQCFWVTLEHMAKLNNNFTTAAKSYFPKYIPKNNIYEINFYNFIKNYGYE